MSKQHDITSALASEQQQRECQARFGANGVSVLILSNFIYGPRMEPSAGSGFRIAYVMRGIPLDALDSRLHCPIEDTRDGL